MKIYTVVGEAYYEGISGLGPSFTDEAKALDLKAKCEAYDKTMPSNNFDSGYREWKAKHPMGCSCDSYDVIGHELIGVIPEDTAYDDIHQSEIDELIGGDE